MCFGKIFVERVVPGSRLRLAVNQSQDDAFFRRFLQRLLAANIDQVRVMLVEPMPRESYLASYAQVDIVLDTFPYTGGTTTCEALWMGVPTLTLKGSAMIARQGAALLSCAGLEEWIASDAQDYVCKAVARSADLDQLAQLRATLRDRALASPLFDGACFARHLGTAFKAMWQQKAEQASQSPPDQDVGVVVRPNEL